VRPDAAKAPAPDTGERTEIAVVAALHRMGADLGEPVRVATPERTGITVFLGDFGADRELEIRTALAAIPGVALRMEQPPPVRSGSATVSLTPRPGPLDIRLEAALGGPAALQATANSVVDEDERLMATAHALHNLDARFPPAREAALTAGGQAVLKEIRADLEESYRGHARKLLALIAPVRHALAATGDAAGSGKFESAKRMDRVVLTLFGGASSGSTPGQLAAELEGAAAQLDRATGGAQ
jgi:hypothetical protein